MNGINDWDWKIGSQSIFLYLSFSVKSISVLRSGKVTDHSGEIMRLRRTRALANAHRIRYPASNSVSAEKF